MGYGIEAAISAKLDNEDLSSLLRDEEFSNKFEEYLDFLREHRVEVPKKINKPNFFSYLSYFRSLMNEPNSYGSIKEHILFDDYYIGNPLTAFEFLVSMAYLSAEKLDSIVKVGIGDSSVLWLDIEFKNGSIYSINRSYFDLDKMEHIPIEGVIPDEDAFTCSEEEMRDFFSISIKERLKKFSATDIFSEFDLDTDIINLSNKNLKDLDESIVKFKKLKELNLSRNRFKKIPEVILKLKGLVKLDISQNQLTEINNGLSKLKCIEVIDLSYNLIKDIPEEICNLKQLNNLNLGSNKLQALPDKLGNLKNLQRLWLSDNDLEKFPNSICELTKLKELGFIRNRKISELPERIGQLIQLNNLRIKHLSIKHLPASFSKLDKLKYLDFHCNPLEGFPDVLAQMKNIEILKIGSNSVIKSIPESIHQMEGLKRLDLSNCNELKILPECIGKLKNLEVLNISDTKVCKLPDSVGQLKKLKELSISQTNITKLPECLKEFDDLEVDSDKGRFIINQSDQLSLFEARGKEVDSFNKEITNEEEFFKTDSFRIGNIFKFCSKKMRSDKHFIKKFTKTAQRSTGYDGLGLDFMDEALKADRNFAKELMIFDKSGLNIRFFNEEIRSDKELLKIAVLGDDEIRGECSNIKFASDKLKNNESFLLDLFNENSALYEFFPSKMKAKKEYALKAVIDRSFIFDTIPDSLKEDEDIIMCLLKDPWFGSTYIPTSYKEDRWFIVRAIIFYDLSILADDILENFKNDELITSILKLKKEDKLQYLKGYLNDNNLEIDLDSFIK